MIKNLISSSFYSFKMSHYDLLLPQQEARGDSSGEALPDKKLLDGNKE